MVSPGDIVTYRFTYRMPTADVENLTLKDYLPSPVFFVHDFDRNYAANTFVTGTTNIPLLGYFGYGPDNSVSTADTSIVVSSGSLLPMIDANPDENSISFVYGTFNDTDNESGVIDLLVSMQVSSYPFADGLLLTNQAREIRTNTLGDEVLGDVVSEFVLGQPDLRIKKGIVARTGSNQANFTATPLPAGVTISAPGTTNCSRFTGTITSTNSANRFDANLNNMNNSGIITFAILVENVGSATNGAFNVQLRDTFQTGYVVPTNGLNLCITRGDGTVIPYTRPDGTPATMQDIFSASGIQLVDQSQYSGALERGTVNNGRNIAVITYDLQVIPTMTPNATIINTAFLEGYAGAETGINAVYIPLNDIAQVTSVSSNFAKTITHTTESYTTGTNVTIGEQVQYTLVVPVANGITYSGLTLTDVLPAGVQLLPGITILASGGLTSTQGTIENIVPVISGNRITINFGTVENPNTIGGQTKNILISYTGQILNITGNVNNVTRTNNARIDWTSFL